MQATVPVHSSTGKVLMPTTNRKANRLVKRGRALRRFDRGLFYIVLTDRADGYTQPVALGIDPGSKKEGYTVQGESHTYLNVQADAVTWVKDAVETRKTMRRNRRYRHAPNRKCRPNRRRGQAHIPPSTRARWGLKLRIATWLARHFPITRILIEDITAVTLTNKRRWNASFSPLEVGKAWAYSQFEQIAPVTPFPSHFTKGLRDQAGLTKSRDKMADCWNAHCIDSFVLASYGVMGPNQPSSTAMLLLTPLRFHRRQLHRLQPAKGGVRSPYGGTRSEGLKRGSWVRHSKRGVCFVGGASNGRVSLHSLQMGKRLSQTAKPTDCKVLCTASWRIRKECVLPPHG